MIIQHGGRRPLKGLPLLFLRYFGVVTLLPFILFLNLPKLLRLDIYMNAQPLETVVLFLRPSLSLARWRSHASLVRWEGPDCRSVWYYSALSHVRTQSSQFHQNSIFRTSDDRRIRFRMRMKWEDVIPRCVDLNLRLRPNEHSPERPVLLGFQIRIQA